MSMQAPRGITAAATQEQTLHDSTPMIRNIRGMILTIRGERLNPCRQIVQIRSIAEAASGAVSAGSNPAGAPTMTRRNPV